MHVDRQRFLLIATALAGCRGEHLAPERVAVAVPREIGLPGADEPLAGAVASLEDAAAPYDDAMAAEALRATCRDLDAPGPSCEGLEETKELCEAYPATLEPAAAERAVACLRGLSGDTSICGYDAAESCFMAATAGALLDPAAAKPCSNIVQKCARFRWTSPELTQAACQHAMSAVRDALDERLISCMTESCGIRRCIYDLADS